MENKEWNDAIDAFRSRALERFSDFGHIYDDDDIMARQWFREAVRRVSEELKK